MDTWIPGSRQEVTLGLQSTNTVREIAVSVFLHHIITEGPLTGTQYLPLFLEKYMATSSNAKKLWDSGKMSSDATVKSLVFRKGKIWAGIALPHTGCLWVFLLSCCRPWYVFQNSSSWNLPTGWDTAGFSLKPRASAVSPKSTISFPSSWTATGIILSWNSLLLCWTPLRSLDTSQKPAHSTTTSLLRPNLSSSLLIPKLIQQKARRYHRQNRSSHFNLFHPQKESIYRDLWKPVAWRKAE